MKKTGLYDLGGVYTIFVRVLAPDLGKMVNRDGKCVILIEHQLDAERFRVRVAPSWELLQSEEYAFICILSKYQLVFANARQVGCSNVSNMVQVAPASILPADLRSLYSSAGLCYYISSGRPDRKGQQEVTVAALPDRLRPHSTGRICSLVLSEEQRALALEYTPARASMPTCDLRDLVMEQCLRIAPESAETLQEPEHERTNVVQQVQQPATQRIPPLQRLETVFVPNRHVYDMAKRMQTNTTVTRHRREKLWLCAALLTLKLQRSFAGGIKLQQNIDLDWNIRCVLVTHLYRRGLPQLIEADPVYTRGKIVGYDIHILVPVEQLAA